MSSPKKIDLQRDFATVVYMSVIGPEPHNPPPPLTHCKRAYSILIRTHRERRGVHES
jgi:hypothetical protein